MRAFSYVKGSEAHYKPVHLSLVRQAGYDVAFTAVSGANTPASDPLEPLLKVLADGESLILFPEGTRGHGALPGPFKSGLYRLAQAMPSVELVPVYLENLHRSLPRGAFLPIPLTCTVRFGAPLAAVAGETKEAFLERARSQVVTLSGIPQ